MEITPLHLQLITLILAGTPISLILLKYLSKIFTKHNLKLGNTTVICTNLIGTLTQKSLMVRSIFFDEFKLTQEEDKNFLKIENTDTKEELLMEMEGLSKDETLKLMATTVILCRYEKLKNVEKTIIDFFYNGGINKHKIHNDYEQLEQISTSDTKKMSSTVVKKKKTNEIFSFTKGQPFTILKNCNRIQQNNKREVLTQRKHRKLRKYIERLNRNGQKVIALAYKPLPTKKLDHYTEDFTENDMIFLGIIGVTQPLNKEVLENIEKTKNAGIKTYILTSDKEKKAIAIGKQLNIINPQYFESITGPYLEQLSDQKLEKMFNNKEKDYIFAELKEEDKAKIINTLNNLGETIAISDRDKKLSFKEIVEGIEKGRNSNINHQKYTNHAIAGKIAELLLLITALIIQVPLPLTIAIIIGLDITVNLLLELVLRTTNTEIDPFSSQYQNSNLKIFKKTNLINILTNGITLGLIATIGFILSLYIYGWTPGEHISLNENIYTKPATITFALLVILQIFNAFNLQSDKESIFKIGFLRNPYLLLVSIISFLLLYIFLNYNLFTGHRSVTAINSLEWQLIFFFAVFMVLIEEFKKFIVRMMIKPNNPNGNTEK